MPNFVHFSPGARGNRPRAFVLASLALAALVTSTLAAPLSATAASPSSTSSSAAAASAGADASATGGYKDGRYVVTLRDDPAASYSGGVGSLKATAKQGARTFAPDAARTVDYTKYLKAQQKKVAASIDVKSLASYTLSTNGFAADLTAGQAQKLAADPRVAMVVPNEILHVTDEHTSTGYLGLEGDTGVWADLGGTSKAGAGVVVGVIDTGIAPENPSFTGEPLGTTDGAAPYKDGSAIVFHKSDGNDFSGVCTTGVQFTADDCSTKIIGARYFVTGFGADHIGSPAVGEYVSPRDGVSHGSHTSSTAAGNTGVVAVGHGSTLSGVAPAAKIAMYKACWSGPDTASEEDDGCATVDLLAAIDAAVGDGVDVINYSIGGGSAQTTNSVTDQAFMAAASAGIFVSASAGNSGPDASTLDNASPWITTVAASTIPASEGTVRLGDGTSALGASITVPAGGVTGSLVYAKDVAASGAADPELCGTGTLDPAKVTGKIVLCDRGVSARIDKSAEVKRAGGIGMILVNTAHDSTDLDAHTVPSVHVDAQYADALHAYATKAGATATLEPGNTSGHDAVPTPQVAGFSSRGPVLADGSDLIKPDVAAPGVNILAATANAAGADPAWGFMSGTSMAAPHVAGLAALYLGQDPTATPAEVKSALMTTAVDTVDDANAPVQDPFAQGNGQVVPTAFLHPGLVYLNDTPDWLRYLQGIGEEHGVEPLDGSDLNLPSIGIGGLAGEQTMTRTVTSTAAGDYTADVTGLTGIATTVSPKTLHFGAAGEKATFTVKFTRESADLGAFSTGYLDWKGADITVRSALAVQPVALDVPKEVAGSGTTGTVAIPASIGDNAAIDILSQGLAHGQRVEGSAVVKGASDRYSVEVPADSTFLRFALDSTDDSADLDLVVYRRTSTGAISLVGASATGSADEKLDVTDVSKGTYIVDVSAYASGTDQSTKQGYALTSYVVTPDAAEGSFTTDPASVDGHVGETATVTAKWSDLKGGSYLGRVRFGDTGLATTVVVDAGADVPALPGDPALTLGPDWVGAASDLRATATGLTPGDTYTASIDGGSVIRSGLVPVSGTIDWSITMPATLTPGAHTLTLTNGTVTLTEPFRVTPVALVGAYGFPTIGFDGNAHARISLSYRGHGTVRFHLESVSTGKSYLDETAKLGEVVGFDVQSADSSTALVDAGDVTGLITVVLPDGSDGPSMVLDTFTAESSAPSSLTFTPTADNANLVNVAVENNAQTDVQSTVRYYAFDGRQVFADGFFKDGKSTQQVDLTGVTRVEYIDGYNTIIGSFDNAAPGRTDSAHLHITQDYWGTMSATPEKNAARPLTLEMNFRPPAYVPGFDLLVGEGDMFTTEPFFSEEIPTAFVETKGDVVTRTMSTRESTRLWTSSNYEIHSPIFVALATADLTIPALSVADLTPVTTPTPPPTETPTPEPTVTATPTATPTSTPTTPPTTTPKPVLTGTVPMIAGTPKVGVTLTARTGTWTKGAKLSYHWFVNGHAVAGATKGTYVPTAADRGKKIIVQVTGTKTGYPKLTKTSVSTRAVAAGTLVSSAAKISGKAKVGATLTAKAGKWTSGTKLSFRWYLGGKPIAHATHSAYKVPKAARGKNITVHVTGTKTGYVSVVRGSAPVRIPR
ncbi:S8 family serine peptidase [Glaciihabitans sp. dw_435]|uniref:S8 family serine peptidase n=1 Tax=Glaciihabitans sp. dw_435 TaxID=2720081 RepID=UPI001BD47F45|nr:S8 family serine peptidase [Glaciihabitans sp. dw_435]